MKERGDIDPMISFLSASSSNLLFSPSNVHPFPTDDMHAFMAARYTFATPPFSFKRSTTESQVSLLFGLRTALVAAAKHCVKVAPICFATPRLPFPDSPLIDLSLLPNSSSDRPCPLPPGLFTHFHHDALVEDNLFPIPINLPFVDLTEPPKPCRPLLLRVLLDLLAILMQSQQHRF